MIKLISFLQMRSMMINSKACFSKHSQWPPESFRLRRLESLCCFILPWMSETFSIYNQVKSQTFCFNFAKWFFVLPDSSEFKVDFWLFSFFFFNCIKKRLMMINFKACFSKHSQWPPKSFRLRRFESLCCFILPWMSETS